MAEFLNKDSSTNIKNSSSSEELQNIFKETSTNISDTSSNVSDISYTVSEPETFETWTLITDQITTMKKKENDPEINGNHIEILKHKTNKICHDLENDEDGISIISDSEIGNRNSSSSPCSNNEEAIKIIKYGLLTPPNTPNKLPNSQPQGINEWLNRFYQRSQNVKNSSIVPTKKRIPTIFFWFTIAGIIAFIAKLKYPEWTVSNENFVKNQKFIELEIQNNILHTEIDKLSKKVNFLHEQYSNYGKNYKHKSKTYNIKNDFNSEEKISGLPANGKIKIEATQKKNIKMPSSFKENLQKHKVVPNDKFESSQKNEDIKNDIDSSYINDKNIKQKKKSKEYNQKEYIKYFNEKTKCNKSHEHLKGCTDKTRAHTVVDKQEKESKMFNNEYLKDKSNFNQDIKTKTKFKKKHEINLNIEKKDWHENMMKNREDHRKNNEKQKTEKWYTNRANGREEARMFKNVNNIKKR